MSEMLRAGKVQARLTKSPLGQEGYFCYAELAAQGKTVGANFLVDTGATNSLLSNEIATNFALSDFANKPGVNSVLGSHDIITKYLSAVLLFDTDRGRRIGTNGIFLSLENAKVEHSILGLDILEKFDFATHDSGFIFAKSRIMSLTPRRDIAVVR